jgi:hypothetical protein
MIFFCKITGNLIGTLAEHLKNFLKKTFLNRIFVTHFFKDSLKSEKVNSKFSLLKSFGS